MFALDHYRQLELAAQPLKDLLRDFTYRPGWHFRADDGQLIINATVIDATDPTKNIPLQFAVGIPTSAGLMRLFDWQRWLFDQIMTVERHEAQEFFKVAGVAVYDPHADQL